MNKAIIENANLIIRGNTLTVTCSGLPNTFPNVLHSACAKLDDVEYIGDRIEPDRCLVTLIRYKGKLYFLYDESRCGTESFKQYSMLFVEYDGVLDGTCPISDYRYVLDYCNPTVHNEMRVQWYYTADEYPIAKRMQERLGQDVTFLKEI